MGVVQRVLGVALVVVLLLLGTVAAGPAARGDAGQEAELFDLLNAFRQSRGVAPVAQDEQLASVARAWASRMQAAGTLSHNPALGSQVTADWVKVAEIVGAGPDVGAVHRAFMASPVHSAKMLDPALTHVGIGVATGGDGRLWVVEDFMRLVGSPAPAPTTTAPPTTEPPPTTARPAPRPVTSTTAPRPRPAPAAPPAEPPASPVADPPVDAAAAEELVPAVEPPVRLVLVLERLRALDTAPTSVPDSHSLGGGWNGRSGS